MVLKVPMRYTIVGGGIASSVIFAVWLSTHDLSNEVIHLGNEVSLLAEAVGVHTEDVAGRVRVLENALLSDGLMDADERLDSIESWRNEMERVAREHLRVHADTGKPVHTPARR